MVEIKDSADPGLFAECSYYKRRISKEPFSGTKTQAIQVLEQKQKDCSSSSGTLDLAGALNQGEGGLDSPEKVKCIEKNLQEFKEAHDCK